MKSPVILDNKVSNYSKENKNIDIEFVKKSDNNILLFGEVGSGKTTILNKLCGTNFETKEDHFSRTTNDIQFGSTSDGNIIVDLPGICPAKKIKEFLKIQISTLSVIPLKLICFIIKKEFRYDIIIKRAYMMSKIFSEHKNNICIIIHFQKI